MLRGQLNEANNKISELEARLKAAEEESAKLLGVLETIAGAKPNWTSGVGSYSGGETFAGFARRLIQTAESAIRELAALKRKAGEA